jgi:autophagy-related protein 9
MQLYSTKVGIFLEEILSVIFTPLILWYSLPQCSDKIIDFFREFTLHIDGVGYVCMSAHFDFEKTGHKSGDPREEYFASKDNKMLTSYLGFMDQYHTSNKHGRRQQTTHPYQQTAYNEHLSQPYQNTHNKNLPQNHRPPQDQRLVQSIYREPSAKVQGSMMQSMLREQPSMQAQHNAMRGSLLDHRHMPKNRQQTLREEDSDSSSDNNLGGSFVHDPEMCEAAQPPIAQQQPNICVLEELNKYFSAHNEGPRPGGAVV